MARRATLVTKGRTTPRKTAAAESPVPAAIKPTRRGMKAKLQEEPPIDTAMPDTASASADETETMSAPKARRGRKPTSDIAAAAPEPEPEMSEAIAEPTPEPPAAKTKTPKSPAMPRKTRRNREPEASAPPPLDLPEETATESHGPSAVEWHAETGAVTFDWSAIEEVAAVEGANQPMAKLLLAARAEGARSRWPF